MHCWLPTSISGFRRSGVDSSGILIHWAPQSSSLGDDRVSLVLLRDSHLDVCLWLWLTSQQPWVGSSGKVAFISSHTVRLHLHTFLSLYTAVFACHSQMSFLKKQNAKCKKNLQDKLDSMWSIERNVPVVSNIRSGCSLWFVYLYGSIKRNKNFACKASQWAVII